MQLGILAQQCLRLAERLVGYMLRHWVNQLCGLRLSRSLNLYRVVGKVHRKPAELEAQRRLADA
jgi:hypothetical protein